MKPVLAHLAAKSDAFAQRPLFSYLRDRSIEPRRRLAVVPFLSHFVMTFADLYAFVLPELPPKDEFEELINVHVREDAGHWRWFLADLGNIGLDPELSFTDALRFVWQDRTAKTRLLSYGVCRLCGSASSLERLVAVQCIEATGAVGLSAFAAASGSLELASKRKLVYFGAHHVETESDHTLEQPSVRHSLEAQLLGDEQRRRALAVIDRVFGLFEDCVDEIFQLTTSGTALVEHDSRSRRGAMTRSESA
jgi:hypothetical protein